MATATSFGTTYDIVWENPEYLAGRKRPSFAGFQDVWRPTKRANASSGAGVSAAFNGVSNEAAKGDRQVDGIDSSLVKVPHVFTKLPTAKNEISFRDGGLNTDDASHGEAVGLGGNSAANMRVAVNNSLSDVMGASGPNFTNHRELGLDADDIGAGFTFVSEFTPGTLHPAKDFPSIRHVQLKLVKVRVQFSKSNHGIDQIVVGMTGLDHGGLHTSHTTSDERFQAHDLLVLCDPTSPIHEEHYGTSVGYASGNISLGVRRFSYMPSYGMCHAGLAAGSNVAYSGLGIEQAPATWASHDPSVVGHTQGHLIRIKMTFEAKV